MAMTIFGYVSLGITGSAIKSIEIAQNNVLSNMAHSVAQGYIEQIKSLPLKYIGDAVNAEANNNPNDTTSPPKVSQLLETVI